MSLRLRLVIAVASVVVVSIAAVAITSSRFVRVELEQLAPRPPHSPVLDDRIAAALAAHHATYGWNGADALLLRLRNRYAADRELVLLDARARLAGTTAPLNGVAAGRGGAGVELKLELPGHAARVSRSRPDAVVRDRSGTAVGTLYALPRIPSSGSDAMRNVNRAMLIIVAAVGVLALLSTAMIARGIFRPVEELEHAVGRIAAGELGHRVPVQSPGEVGRLAQAFNAMSEQLQRDETLRRNLINDVAHELRTPLTNLICTVEAIQDGLRAPEPRVIGSLHEELTLLQHVVDDLQTLALAEAGRLPLQREEIELSEVVARFVSTQQEEVRPRIEVDVASGVRLHGDRRRIQQILANLVRNAFTHGGPHVRVAISARRLADGVELRVSDDGAGIAREHLPHIFDRFYRADASRGRATGGAGLGLSIVKNLVALHGGRIDVASDRGTTFVMTFPAAA